MTISLAIHSLGSVGLFPSRAFLPALMTAVLMRFGSQIPLVSEIELVQQMQPAGGGSWFTHGMTIALLAVLSLCELVATKNVDARDFLNQLDRYLKPVMALLTSLGLISAADMELVDAIQRAGIGETAWVLISSAAVAVAAKLRREILEFLEDIDPEDDLKLQAIISWSEELWMFCAFLLLVILPLLMIIISGMIMLGLYLIRKRLEKREAQRRIPCPRCSEQVFPCALSCHHCNQPIAQPCAVGFFGQSVREKIADRDRLPYQLIEHKRCPICASRLTERTPEQTCSTCGYTLTVTSGYMAGYDAFIHGRQKRVLSVCLLLGAIPILGTVPGLVYYRIQLVSPYRRYIPRWRITLLRWLGRFLSIVLIAIQPIPVIGALSLPLSALLNHYMSRRTFLQGRIAPLRNAGTGVGVQSPRALAVEPREAQGSLPNEKTSACKIDPQITSMRCPTCSSLLRLRAKHRGRRVRCPKCRKPFKIPESQPPLAAPPIVKRPPSGSEE